MRANASRGMDVDADATAARATREETDARCREGAVGTDARESGPTRAREETRERARQRSGSETSSVRGGVERGRGVKTPSEETRLYERRRSAWEALSRDAIGECAKGTLRDSWLWEKLSDVTKRVSEGERAATLLDYLPDDEDRVAVDCVDGTRRGMTHKELRILIDRVSEKDMPEWGVRSHGRRVAVLVPNGPELMTTLMCVMQRHCAVPINPATTQEAIEEELISTNAQVLLYQRDGGKSDAKMRRLCKKLGLTPSSSLRARSSPASFRSLVILTASRLWTTPPATMWS